MTHPQSHPLAGQVVEVAAGRFAGQQYRVEDWWDRIAGKSWMDCRGNPAALSYAVRSGLSETQIPIDDEVVYGKIGPFGHLLLHVSELAMQGTA